MKKFLYMLIAVAAFLFVPTATAQAAWPGAGAPAAVSSSVGSAAPETVPADCGTVAAVACTIIGGAAETQWPGSGSAVTAGCNAAASLICSSSSGSTD